MQVEKQEEFLIDKIEELKALRQEYENLTKSHVSLTSKYKSLKKEHACAANSCSFVATMQEENGSLKARLEELTIKHETLHKDHEELLCSHEKLVDIHVMLKVAHEVEITLGTSSRPHSHELAYTSPLIYYALIHVAPKENNCVISIFL